MSLRRAGFSLLRLSRYSQLSSENLPRNQISLAQLHSVRYICVKLTIMKYKRILLKLSGEAPGGTKKGFGGEKLHQFGEYYKGLKGGGGELAIGMGGGNIFRGG